MALIFFEIAFLSLLPFLELRGSIPYGFLMGKNPFLVFLVAVSSNLLVSPTVFFFLDSIHPLLNKNRFYKAAFTKIIRSKREKAAKYTERYGWMGLALFTSIPLPLTGAYTASMAAWALGIERKRAVFAISTGVLVAGAIVTAVLIIGLEGWFLIRRSIN